MIVLAVDPGTRESAFVTLDTQSCDVIDYGYLPNSQLMDIVRCNGAWDMAIEGLQCQGMAVGKETFLTGYWIGRYIEAFGAKSSDIVYRSQVKINLCGSAKAKDANIRQAIIDRYGGKEAAIGNKKNPGPLYGITSHTWSALAVGLTWKDLRDGNYSFDRVA